MLGSNSHIVLNPINKKKELNMVCIMRCMKYEPENVKQLVQEIFLKQNPKFKNIFDLEFDRVYYCYSIYFDDLNFSTLRQKQEGATERHKIRLRTYFSDLNDEIKLWNLEIKSKKNNTVKKRKIEFSNQDVLYNLKNKETRIHEKLNINKKET